MELTKTVKTKLVDLVEAIADEKLEGKPAVLANAIYFNLEREIIKQIENIEQTFG